MVGFYHSFVVKLISLKFSFRIMLKNLDQDQDRHSVGSDLGPNCLKRLPSDEKVAASKERYCHKITLGVVPCSLLVYSCFCAVR